MKIKLYRPFKEGFSVTQEFGENPETYKWIKDVFGNPIEGHNYNSIANLPYLDFIGLTVIPLLGKSLLGILNTLVTSLFIKPIHTAKSKLSELRLKVQHPTVLLTGLPRLNFLLYNSQTFRSIFSLFQKKSKGVFNDLLGLLAPNLSMNHSSHLIPFCGLPEKMLFLDSLWRRYQARLLHKSEQYIVLYPLAL